MCLEFSFQWLVAQLYKFAIIFFILLVNEHVSSFADMVEFLKLNRMKGVHLQVK